MNKTLLVIAAILFGILGSGQLLLAQQLQQDYKAVNRTISAGTETGSIHLNEADGDGLAIIKGKSFTNGTIEVDIKGRDVQQRSFVGIAFHAMNDSTFEAIYFRPFNFRAADPVKKVHMVQYVAEPKYGWEKLRNTFPNKYEKSITPAPDPNQWFHAKIVVAGKKISVYINGEKTPSLSVESLVNYNGRMIGYMVGNGSDGDWKNLKITASGN